MPSKSSKPKGRVELRVQTYEDLKSYSYTLRALRTSAILDASGHILDVLANENAKLDDGKGSLDEPNQAAGEPSTEGPQLAEPANSVANDVSTGILSPFIEGGPKFSTLWPDGTTATYIPEWSFEEEIEAVLRLCFQSVGKRIKIPLRNDSDTDPEGGQEQSGSCDAVEISPEYLQVLVEQVRQALARIFSYLAMHRAEDPPDRALHHHAMGWEQVLEILNQSGIIPESVIETVRSRMAKSLYPTPATKQTSEDQSSPNKVSKRTRKRIRDLEATVPGAGNVLLANSLDMLLQSSYKRPPDTLLHVPKTRTRHRRPQTSASNDGDE